MRIYKFYIFFLIFVLWGCSVYDPPASSYHSIQYRFLNTYSLSHYIREHHDITHDIDFCSEFNFQSNGLKLFVDCDIKVVEPQLIDQLLENFLYVLNEHRNSVFSNAVPTDTGFCIYLVSNNKSFTFRKKIDNCMKLYFAAPDTFVGSEFSSDYINLQFNVIGTSFHELYHFITHTIYGGHDNSWLEEYRAYLYTYYIRTILAEKIYGSPVRMRLDVSASMEAKILEACRGKDEAFFISQDNLGTSGTGGFFAGKFVKDNLSSSADLEAVIFSEIDSVPRRGDSSIHALLRRFSYCLD